MSFGESHNQHCVGVRRAAALSVEQAVETLQAREAS